MEKDRDIKDLKDLTREVFIASATSWTYQIAYNLMDRRIHGAEVYAYGIGKDGLAPLRAVNVQGSHMENSELILSKPMENKVKKAEAALKRAHKSEQEYQNLMQEIYQGAMIISISGDIENTSLDRRHRDKIRQQISRMKGASTDSERKLQSIIKEEVTEWASLHSPLLRYLSKAIKRESSALLSDPKGLSSGLQRLISEAVGYHNRADKFLDIGIYKIRNAVKQKGTLHRFFTQDEISEIDIGTDEDIDDRLSLVTYLVMQALGFGDDLKFSTIREVSRTRLHTNEESSDAKSKEQALGWKEGQRYTLNESFESLHYENDFKKVTNIVGKELGENFKSIIFLEVTRNQPMNRKKVITISKNLKENSSVKEFLEECSKRWYELANV